VESQLTVPSDHPVRFSEGLVNTLQDNPEVGIPTKSCISTLANTTKTDSSRAKNLELIIQQRVTAELQKHLQKADSKFTSLSESISNESDSPSRSSSGPSLTEKPLLSRLTEKITGSSSEEPAQAPTESKQTGLDRNAVAKDLEDLRKKLNSRKRIMEKDDAVEKAKDAVVACLKVNDRRPLDCWQEVEKFKAEVGRLERTFVDKNAA
jgi:altered-inheritance-of-mitochondria protein 13